MPGNNPNQNSRLSEHLGTKSTKPFPGMKGATKDAKVPRSTLDVQEARLANVSGTRTTVPGYEDEIDAKKPRSPVKNKAFRRGSAKRSGTP